VLITKINIFFQAIAQQLYGDPTFSTNVASAQPMSEFATGHAWKSHFPGSSSQMVPATKNGQYIFWWPKPVLSYAGNKKV